MPKESLFYFRSVVRLTGRHTSAAKSRALLALRARSPLALEGAFLARKRPAGPAQVTVKIKFAII